MVRPSPGGAESGYGRTGCGTGDDLGIPGGTGGGAGCRGARGRRPRRPRGPPGRRGRGPTPASRALPRLAALAALQRTDPVLRHGWVVVTGTIEVDDRPTTLC